MADTLVGIALDGRYRLVELLFESGPRGVIYRAEDARSSRTLAVRVFPGRPGSELEESLRKLSCIRHSNIAPVIDFGRTDEGRPFVVTDLLTGESVADRLDEPADQREVLAFLEEACAALAEAHAVDRVHGRIKPANLFFDADRNRETLRLIDFDLPDGRAPKAFIMDDVRANADWVAPEQAKGQTAEPASDIYALGAIAYAWLAGHPPHDGEPHVVLSKKIDRDPDDLAQLRSVEVDEEVDRLILSMLDREPSQRPSAREVMEHASSLRAGLAMPIPIEPSTRLPWFGLAAVLIGAAALLGAEIPSFPSKELRAPFRTGRISLESVPPGAAIYVDGEPLLTLDGTPSTTPADVQSLIYGQRYRVQLKKAGYVDWETEVRLDAFNDDQNYRTLLSPLATKKEKLSARLTVTGDPFVDVYVDGTQLESRPRGPIVDRALLPGVHRLTIKSASEVRTLMIDAAPGDSIRYHVWPKRDGSAAFEYRR